MPSCSASMRPDARSCSASASHCAGSATSSTASPIMCATTRRSRASRRLWSFTKCSPTCRSRSTIRARACSRRSSDGCAGSTATCAASIAFSRASTEALPLTRAELKRFMTPRGFPLRALRPHWRFDSPVLRHALRMGLALGAAYYLALALPWSSHPWWLVLSVGVVLRGNLGETLARRNARVAGTLLGCLVVVVLSYVATAQQLTGVFLAALATAHAFVVQRYWLTATAASVMALLQSHLVNPEGGFAIAERVADTFLGALLAWCFSYVLPSWERRGVAEGVARVLRDVHDYASQSLRMAEADPVEERLARRRAYDSLAALSTALRRSRVEPKGVRLPAAEIATLIDHGERLMAHLSMVRITVARLKNEASATLHGDADAGIGGDRARWPPRSPLRRGRAARRRCPGRPRAAARAAGGAGRDALALAAPGADGRRGRPHAGGVPHGARGLRRARSRAWPGRRPRRREDRSARPASRRRGASEAAPGQVLQLVDAARRRGLAQGLVEVDVRLLAEGLQVGALRAGHRLVAGDPVRGILFHVAGVGAGLGAFIGHAHCRQASFPRPASRPPGHRRGVVVELDPGRRVIARCSRPRISRSTPARARRRPEARAHEQVVDAQSGVARPAVAQAVPEGVEARRRDGARAARRSSLARAGGDRPRAAPAAAARCRATSGWRRCRGRSARRCSRRRGRPDARARRGPRRARSAARTRRACSRTSGRAAGCRWAGRSTEEDAEDGRFEVARLACRRRRPAARGARRWARRRARGGRRRSRCAGRARPRRSPPLRARRAGNRASTAFSSCSATTSGAVVLEPLEQQRQAPDDAVDVPGRDLQRRRRRRGTM